MGRPYIPKPIIYQCSLVIIGMLLKGILRGGQRGMLDDMQKSSRFYLRCARGKGAPPAPPPDAGNQGRSDMAVSIASLQGAA